MLPSSSSFSRLPPSAALQAHSARFVAASDVDLRIKPNSSTSNEGIYALLDPTTLLVRRNENTDRRFNFTRIFGPSSSQADLFDDGVRQRVIDLLHGTSSTILAYGASNSGKTYTLYGTPCSPGLVPRAVEFLFSAVNCTLDPWYKVSDDNRIIVLDEHERALEKQQRTNLINPKTIGRTECTSARLSLDNSRAAEERVFCDDESMSSVWISIWQIYNDNVHDLLTRDQKSCPLKMSTRKDGTAFVNGLRFVHVTSAFEACQLLILAQSRMTTVSTASNGRSSRSHAFLALKLLKYQTENAPDTVQLGTLTFCDLAGGGCFKKLKETGVRLTELKSINYSLLVLRRCLKAVRDSHPNGDQLAGPFRECKLTRILQKCLTGREKMHFIVTVDCGIDSFVETLSVLSVSSSMMKLGIGSRERGQMSNESTPRSTKSSVLSSFVQSVEKDFDNQAEYSIQGLESKNEVQDHEEEATMSVSKPSGSRETLLSYKELQNANRKLRDYLEALKCHHLNRELEIRQELAGQFSASVRDLEASWKQHARDIEKEGRELLKLSVKQVEMFYKERIDNIMCNKKRKRSDCGDSPDERSVYEELETENALVTSKLVVLRETVQCLRNENELLSTDRNKCNFELTLLREKLKDLQDLTRAHFPKLFLNVENDDVVWMFHKIICMVDEKTKTIEKLEKDLSSRNKKNSILKDSSICSDEFFCGDNIDTSELITQAHVDVKSSRTNIVDKSSSKKLSLGDVDIEVDYFGDGKEDSGIDSSYRSRRSTDVNETKDKYVQTPSNFETRGIEGESEIIGMLLKVIDSKEEELLESTVKVEELKRENERSRLIEVDSSRHDERINDLTSKLDDSLDKCIQLENRLSIFHENLLQVSQIEKLKKELMGRCSQASKMANELEEARSDLFRVHQLHDRVNELETVLEKWQGERSDYRERLRELLEAQSMLEAELKRLSTEIRRRDEQLISLQAEINNLRLINSENSEETKSLSERVVRSNETVRNVKKELSNFVETQRYAKVTSKEDREGIEEELDRLRAKLLDDEREMDLLEKHQDVVKHLMTEIEKRDKQLRRLRKLFSPYCLRRPRRFYNRRCRKFRNRNSFPADAKDKKEGSASSSSSSIDGSRNVRSLTSNEAVDSDSACQSERSCPTESSSNDLKVEERRSQNDTSSDYSEVRCGCGISFKGAQRRRASGWMRVRTIDQPTITPPSTSNDTRIDN